MSRKRVAIFAVLALCAVLAAATMLTAAGAPRAASDAAPSLGLYDWCVTDENGEVAQQTRNGIAISAPGYYRKALQADNLSVEVDFTTFADNGGDNNPQNIAYFVFSSIGKAAHYDYTATGDGLYIQMRNYADSGLFVSVDYVENGASHGVVGFAQDGSHLEMNKTELTAISLRSDISARRKLVFTGVGGKETAIDISAVPLACYAQTSAATPYCYFGTFTWGDNGITASDRTFTVKRVTGATGDESLTDTTGRAFAEEGYAAEAQNGKTVADEWLVNSGTVNGTEAGVTVAGDSVLYNYRLSDEKITVYTDFSDGAETTYDNAAQNLVYFGFTKEQSSAAGYTLPGSGLWLLFRNYGGWVHLAVYNGTTPLIDGTVASAATGIRATDLKTIALEKLQGTGYALYLNGTRVALTGIENLAHNVLADENGTTVFSVCTWSTAGQLLLPVNNVQGTREQELVNPDWETGATVPSVPKEKVTLADFTEIKDNGLDSVSQTADGIAVTGGGFYGYTLAADKETQIFVSLPALLESTVAGNAWAQQGLAYLCLTKNPTNARYDYPQAGLYIMFRNMGGYLTVTVATKGDDGQTENRIDAMSTRIRTQDLRYIALRPIAQGGYTLQINDRTLKNNSLSSLAATEIADDNGNTYLGVYTWSDVNAAPERERTLLLSAVVNTGKAPFAASDYYYYDSGETVTAPDTVIDASEFTFLRTSAYDVQEIVADGIKAAGGGYADYKYAMQSEGDTVRVFASLSALKESTYDDAGQYAAQGLAYFCFTDAPTSAHYTCPEKGIYLMFRNVGGYVRLQVQYKYEDGHGDTVTQTLFADSAAAGNTGLTPQEITSFALCKTASGYKIMLNDKDIRVDFNAIPDGIVADNNGFTYVGLYTWTSPDEDPLHERAVTLHQIVGTGKEAFTPVVPQYYVTDGEMLTSDERVTLNDFVFRADAFYDVAEETENGVLLSKPGYYNYALTPDDVTVFVSLPALQATPSDYSRQGLLYLYFGSTPVEASWDYQGRGIYIMLRNVNGYIVIQVTYRSAAGSSTIIGETGIDAVTPLKVEELRYVRMKKAEEGFDIWLNNIRVNSEKLKAIPHDVAEDKDGNMYFGFCTWSSPDLSPQTERTVLISAVVNAGKTAIVDRDKAPSKKCGCGSQVAATTLTAGVLLLAAAGTLATQHGKKKKVKNIENKKSI